MYARHRLIPLKRKFDPQLLSRQAVNYTFVHTVPVFCLLLFSPSKLGQAGQLEVSFSLSFCLAGWSSLSSSLISSQLGLSLSFFLPEEKTKFKIEKDFINSM